MSYLIKNGRIVTSEKVFRSDLLIENDIISRIDKKIKHDSARVIDATNMYILPGGIDAHTHLEMPYENFKTTDTFKTGTIAAAFGGTTTIIDFVNPEKGQSLLDAFNLWFSKAYGKTVIDYSFHMTIVQDSKELLSQMEDVVNMGVTSFKMFTDYPDKLMVEDETILKVLKWTKQRGCMPLVHAINGLASKVFLKQAEHKKELEPKYYGVYQPTVLEGEATTRVLAMAESVKSPIYIVHISCKESLEALVSARLRGVNVYGETCPQYLYLSQKYLELPKLLGAKYVCNPPLRKKAHLKALWKGLTSDVINTISTDHCPFNFKEHKSPAKKDFRMIPKGLPGIETRLALMYKGVVDKKISLSQFVNLVSTMPAKIFNLYPKKGNLSVGADADIVVWNPDKVFDLSVKNLHMNVDYSPYEGMKLMGKPEKVFLRGKLIVDKDRFTGKAGHGKFISRTPVEYIL